MSQTLDLIFYYIDELKPHIATLNVHKNCD